LSAKLPVISGPQFPLSLLEVSHVVVGVGGGAPGGASGNFQSRVSTISTISLQDAVHPRASAARSYQEKKCERRTLTFLVLRYDPSDTVIVLYSFMGRCHVPSYPQIY
jgi:hypothetical protein